MRTLDRLVASQFMRLFFVSILALPMLFALGEFTERYDDYAAVNLTTAEILHGYLYRIPEWFVWSFPIAGLVAAIFTVHAMTTHREIVAAKAGGISFHRLMLPIIVLSVLMTGVAFLFTDLTPGANRTSSQILKKIDFGEDWKTDLVYRTDNGYTLSARRLIVSEARMYGVLLMLKGKDTVPTIHVQADEARYAEGEGWTLLNGSERRLYAGLPEQYTKFDTLRTGAITERPEELLDTPREESEMTYSELGRAARVIERSGGRFAPMLVARHERIAIPIATLVIVLFGLPLATSSNRGGAAYGIGAALGTTILYLLLFKVSLAVGSSGSVPAHIAAWTPNAIFFLTATFFLAKVRT